MKKFLVAIAIAVAVVCLFKSIPEGGLSHEYNTQGWVPDPQATAEFERQYGQNAYLETAAPHLLRGDDDRSVFLYKAVQKVAPDHFPLNQSNVGSCVSFGTGACVDTLLAMQVVEGKVDQFIAACEESIYGGARVQAWGRQTAPGGDGASGVGAAKWISGWGIAYRIIYPELNGLDLRLYDTSRCRDWGYYGSGGRQYRSQLDLICKEHPVRQVTLVRSAKEAKAALQSGYPINVCSGQGFNNQRDSQGFLRPSGSWSHSMAILGYVGGERPGFIILNSWGKKWVSGPKGLDPDMPDGAFLADFDVVDRMLRGGDSYAYSDLVGFPRKQLNNSLYW